MKSVRLIAMAAALVLVPAGCTKQSGQAPTLANDFIGGKKMDSELDSMMGFDTLDLYFEAHMAGIDGECFNYSVYFENGVSADKLEEINDAIKNFVETYDEKEIYLGYIDTSMVDDKVNIYLDLGNVKPEYSDIAIQGILKAMNQVAGIKKVIVNEDSSFDF